MITLSVPCIHDHHSHFSLYAALSAMPSLADIADYDQACEIIKKNIFSPITVIQGWNSSSYNLTPAELGDEHPVIVFNISLHGMIMNRPAREYLLHDYPSIAMNYINPIWIEKNLPQVLGMITCLTPPSPENIRAFGFQLLNAGIAAIEDMLLPDSRWFDLILNSPVPVEFWADEGVYSTLKSDEKANIKGIKIFLDGAIGTKTAAISKPYLSGEKGILLIEDDKLTSRLHNYMKQGIPLAMHAIGDIAVEQAVNTVKILRCENGCSGPVRIEHAQFITKKTAFIAREQGITLSMQPNFSSDSKIYSGRLPHGYPAMNNPFRMLIDDAGFIPGKNLIFGSDGMPHGLQPALQSALFPPFTTQLLTISEFKAGYCLTGAADQWQVFIDNRHIDVSLL